jgi:putative hydrolase of the HAD superfamily
MIKNIVFDFGDVFINLDKEATFVALSKLGVEEVTDEMLAIAKEYEVGAISTEAFVRFFQQKFSIANQQLIDAWNTILLDFPKRRLKFLKDLAASSKYRLFLLSNTNELHISWIQNDWGMSLYNEFKNCFEQFYLSHEIGLRKPNADIYEYVLEKNNLVAAETYFVDDTEENTVAAEKLGIKVWNINPKKEDVTTLLTKKEFN